MISHLSMFRPENWSTGALQILLILPDYCRVTKKKQLLEAVV